MTLLMRPLREIECPLVEIKSASKGERRLDWVKGEFMYVFCVMSGSGGHNIERIML